MKSSTITTVALMFALGGAAQAAPAAPVDKAFVDKVSQGGLFEVEASKLALTKATTQDLKDQANTEVHDHELVGAKLKETASKAGLTFPAPLNGEFTKRLDALKALAGTAFDAAYLQEMDTIHDADGAAFGAEATDGQDAGLKAFAAETHVIVERHIGSLRAVPIPK